MANTKKATKKIVKKTAKKAMKNKGVVAFLVILVLIIVGAVVTGYVIYNPKVNSAKNDLNKVSQALQDDYLELSVTSDVNLPKKIEGYDVSIEYTSSDSSVMTSDGKVTPPSFSDGDKTVTITATLTPTNKDAIFGIFWNFLGEKKTVTLKFIVKAKGASSSEKLAIIESGLFVPSETSCSIGLLKEEHIFNDVTISWSSSNPSVITNDGTKVSSGDAVLTATLSCQGETKTVKFSVKVLDHLPTIEVFNVNFDDYPKSTYAADLTKDNITYVGSIFASDDFPTVYETDSDSLLEQDDKIARFKSTNTASSYLYTTTLVENPKEISFSYGLYKSDSSKTNKDSFLNVYYSSDLGANWTLLSSDKLTSSWVDYNKKLDLVGSFTFKVEFTTTYSELRLDLDDLVITRELSTNDVYESLVNSFSPKFSSNRILPQTTKYGGIITWTSSSPNLTSDGIVTKLSESQKVNLTATITGFSSSIKVDFEATISGLNAVTPVELYFIDLGKYGTSDCGESILIKYGSFDFLIDCGDEINASNQAIQEAIDAYSEDRIIDYLLVTHPDSDHMGGAPFILTNYEVLNLVHFNGEHTSNLYQKFLQAVSQEGCNECSALDSYNNVGQCKRIIEFGNDVYIEILNTTHYDGKETNTRSVVCVLNAYGTRVLLTGDADNGSISTLEADYANSVGDIDILKVVHHGTANGTTLDFLKAVDPEVAIICNGNYLGNKHGHPTPEAINRIYQYDKNIPIYTITGGACNEVKESKSAASYRCVLDDAKTDRNGTIFVIIDNNGYSISSEYYGDHPLELSSTNYWITNPWREYSYQGK